MQRSEEIARQKSYYVCKHCGGQFHPKAPNRTTFCGRVCSFGWLRAHGSLHKSETKERYKTKGRIVNDRKWMSKMRLLAKKRQAAAERKCIVCRSPVSPESYGAVDVCSIDCRKVYNRIYTHVNFIRGKETKRCYDCHRRFYPAKAESRCSGCQAINAEARRKVSAKKFKRQRRLRKKINHLPYTREFVLHRDGRVCAACFRTVSECFDVSDDCYPNIDHVIPLAKGGSDTPDNVRTLCRRCNIIKGDKRDGEWEHLIDYGVGAGCISKAV